MDRDSVMGLSAFPHQVNDKCKGASPQNNPPVSSCVHSKQKARAVFYHGGLGRPKDWGPDHLPLPLPPSLPSPLTTAPRAPRRNVQKARLA